MVATLDVLENLKDMREGLAEVFTDENIRELVETAATVAATAHHGDPENRAQGLEIQAKTLE